MTRPIPAPRASPDADPTPLFGTAVHYPRGGSEALCETEAESLAAHLHRLGARQSCSGSGGHDLLARLDEAALTGHGGGHFPVAGKWRTALAARLAGAGVPLVVGNGAEGEPLSRKDAALLELRPHLVLDGLACAAETLGASGTVLWLHDGAHGARSSITRALAERHAHRLDEPAVRVAFGPDHYLTGQSSAVVSALSGGPARPRFTRVPSARSGVDGRPTVVQNVESLARVALLARGVDPRSVLLTVASPHHLVVVELPETTGLQTAATSTLGGPAPQALLLGGYGGRWIGWEDAAALTLEPATLREVGLSTGAGILAPLARGECGLRRTADIVDFLADVSARQCGPCLFGLPAVAGAMGDLAATRAGRRDSRRLERFLGEVDGRGACHHPDGAVRLVRSALETFRDDVAAHLTGHCLHTSRRAAACCAAARR